MQNLLHRCCENAAHVLDNGYITCVSCGCVHIRELDVANTAFGHTPSRLKTNYTRSGRFATKIIGSLLKRHHHNMDESLLATLRARAADLKTPEDLLLAISRWEGKGRKPYIFAVRYWEALGRTMRVISDKEERFICNVFGEIFFAAERLEIEGPRFPMTTLLQLIVEEFEMSPEAIFMIRFTKRLRCQFRQARYTANFKRCISYIKKNESRCNPGWKNYLKIPEKRSQEDILQSAAFRCGRL
jgi:hypothetical protein